MGKKNVASISMLKSFYEKNISLINFHSHHNHFRHERWKIIGCPERPKSQIIPTEEKTIVPNFTEVNFSMKITTWQELCLPKVTQWKGAFTNPL